MTAAGWPQSLWLIRHGESAANSASREAEAAGALEIPLITRDMDTPLTEQGIDQAKALGQWLARLDVQPDTILASPYVRTRQTVDALLAQSPDRSKTLLRFDERLRERERGVYDGLTKAGVEARIPEEAKARAFIGKFYHRARGGESWCDVVQRLRAVVDRVLIQHAGERVMIVTHEVVIYCLRYILEDMDEAEILAIDAKGDIPNASVTEYRLDAAGKLRLARFAESVA